MTAEAAGELVRRLAPAKVNLTLHVLGQRPDGYHRLESLVAFPAIGDVVEAEPARGLGLSLGGPYGFELGAGADNIVLRAAAALRARLDVAAGASIHLTKQLPIASGVGGGSSDAAAVLRALSALWGAAPTNEAMTALALELGADVPVCLRAPALSIMRGVGEDVSPAPPAPAFWLTLVNPGAPVATPDVFNALHDKRNAPHEPDFPEAGLSAFSAFASWLAVQRNDLEAPAIAVQPAIAAVRAALDAQPHCRLARMSGSGATCWGLFETQAAALAAAEAIRAAEPSWWVAAGPVAETPAQEVQP